LPIEKQGIVWGLLLAVVATGLYDTIRALLDGNYGEETKIVFATLVVVAVLFTVFNNILFKKE